MDGVAILLGLAIAVLVAAYVAQPLARKQRRATSLKGESPREKLETDYRMVLEAIRDLDFDFQTGKVLEEDYQPLRERYAAQGAVLLKELDQLGGDAAMEKVVRTRRKQRRAVAREASSQTLQQSDEIEAMIQARRKQIAVGQTCSACGQPCLPDDLFCGKCGTALEAKT